MASLDSLKGMRHSSDQDTKKNEKKGVSKNDYLAKSSVLSPFSLCVENQALLNPPICGKNH